MSELELDLFLFQKPAQRSQPTGHDAPHKPGSQSTGHVALHKPGSQPTGHVAPHRTQRAHEDMSIGPMLQMKPTERGREGVCLAEAQPLPDPRCHPPSQFRRGWHGAWLFIGNSNLVPVRSSLSALPLELTITDCGYGPSARNPRAFPICSPHTIRGGGGWLPSLGERQRQDRQGSYSEPWHLSLQKGSQCIS